MAEAKGHGATRPSYAGYLLLSWDAEQEQRLIEMVRDERTLEEISREVSVPVDVLVERMRELSLDDGFERPW